MRRLEAAGLDALFDAGRDDLVFQDLGSSCGQRHVKSGQKGQSDLGVGPRSKFPKRRWKCRGRLDMQRDGPPYR